MSVLTKEQIIQLLADSINSPKRVKNDAGEVESHDIDKLLKALDYANKLNAVDNPFACLRQAKIKYKDIWQERD